MSREQPARPLNHGGPEGGGGGVVAAHLRLAPARRRQPHACDLLRCIALCSSLRVGMLFTQTGLVDMDKLEEKAMEYRPKMIICGASAYPRDWDYARFREIADKVGALLMVDMAHIRWAARKWAGGRVWAVAGVGGCGGGRGGRLRGWLQQDWVRGMKTKTCRW